MLSLVGDPATFRVGSAIGLTFAECMRAVSLCGVLAVLDPRQLVINTNAPPVHLERITYRDQAGISRVVPWDGRSDAVVPAGALEVGFRWTALSYSAPEKIRCAYRLGGDSTPWVDAGGRRSLDLNRPGPARLRFEVKAANNDGIWSGRPAVVGVVSPPPRPSGAGICHQTAAPSNRGPEFHAMRGFFR